MYVHSAALHRLQHAILSRPALQREVLFRAVMSVIAYSMVERGAVRRAECNSKITCEVSIGLGVYA